MFELTFQERRSAYFVFAKALLDNAPVEIVSSGVATSHPSLEAFVVVRLRTSAASAQRIADRLLAFEAKLKSVDG